MPSRSGWLAGAWIAHTFSLRIDRAGRGTLLWRTYRRCGHDAPPCDSFRGDAVVDGGRATATFTTHGRVVASGRVLTSTDPIHFPIGSLRVRFDRKNDLLYMRPTPRTPLCGPAAAAVHCG